MKKVNKIGVLTSGGDSPGMNAAVRAVVRCALANKLEAVGVICGYDGLINANFKKMESHSVSNIIQRGGTILKTARSERFRTEEGRELAYQNMMKEGIDGLVVIGGDGSFRGAHALSTEHGIPIMGAPGTIDNDLYGTDFTIGFDTAINTVIDVVDKLRDTADSHNRLFFVEVMGRDAGFIALQSGIAVGAEYILIPETKTDIHRLINVLEKGFRKNKTSGIIIVAEGDDAGGAYDVAKKVKEKYNHYETRVAVIGHMQRGGSPTCKDRLLASTMGYEAVEALINGRSGEMVGIMNDKVVYTPFLQATKHHMDINHHLLKMAEILSL